MSNLKFKDPSTGNWTTIAPTAGGVPSGGTTGQVLKKTSGGYGWNTLSASDIGAVANSGNETVSGNKTFSGKTTLSRDSTYPLAVNTQIKADSAAIIQSPIPKYLWHDLWAFCRDCEPVYYTTTDGTTWTQEALNRRLFYHRRAWGKLDVISDTIAGSRWEWTTSTWWYGLAQWIVIGVAYSSPATAKFDILFEQLDDSNNWSTLLSCTNCWYSQTPVWFKSDPPTRMTKIRLTITRSAEDQTTNALPLTSMMWLSYRWGDQGKGDENEYPYDWDVSLDIYPIANDSQTLGTSNRKWKDIYTNKINGVAPKNLYVVSTAPTSSSADGIYFVTSS